jgi:hypothetical protein
MRFHRTIGVATALATSMIAAAAPAAAAPAETITEHNVVQFEDPGFIGPCDGSTGTLTLDGQEVFHLTDSGRTFRLSATLRATFSIDFDDPEVGDLTGRVVSQHRENVNYSQWKDYRVTDDVHAIATSADGSSLPVHTKFTVLYGADGTVEVKIDSTRCGGQAIS